MEGPVIEKSEFSETIGSKRREPDKVVAEPIIVDKNQNKEQLADEKAVSQFAKAKNENDCPVDIVLRARPFQKNETLDKERNKPSYFATDNLMCVKGKQTKFEIIKFRKIY